ncbi:hypothetical protein [Absidia glauca]|uniref:Uncharacterized protein n=1 Tax=Absidia glauca TaxID=4829 RepID=A0A168SF00_ABSGL|nr:hypothetical protein [Absidia glauca]
MDTTDEHQILFTESDDTHYKDTLAIWISSSSFFLQRLLLLQRHIQAAPWVGVPKVNTPIEFHLNYGPCCHCFHCRKHGPLEGPYVEAQTPLDYHLANFMRHCRDSADDHLCRKPNHSLCDNEYIPV